MAKQNRRNPSRIKSSERCPCGTGKTYKNCCWNKDFDWIRAEDGVIRQVTPLHQEASEILKGEFERFQDLIGRQPREDERVFFHAMHGHDSEYITQAIITGMTKAGLPKANIYAFAKTGLLVTEDNIRLLPQSDYEEWCEAMDEFNNSKSQPSKLVRQFLKHQDTMILLTKELENLTAIFMRFVNIYGEISTQGKTLFRERDSLQHDFVMFCLAKSLKTLDSIKVLCEQSKFEDCLVLLRTILEIYFYLAHLAKSPNQFEELVEIQIKRKLNLCEAVIQEENGRRRKVLLDKSTGKAFRQRISLSEVAYHTISICDREIYDNFYPYLSEYCHPSFMVIDDYTRGGRLDFHKSNDEFRTYLNTIVLGLMLLDTFHFFDCFDKIGQKDLGYYLTRTIKLILPHLKAPKTQTKMDFLGQRLLEIKERWATIGNPR